MMTNPIDNSSKQADSVELRQQAIVSEFSGLADWEERYKKIIEIGKSLPSLPEDKKVEDFKVRGCQSQVWIYASLEDGKVVYRADSDAILVRGLVSLCLRVYSNAKPEEIMQSQPHFIAEIGLESHLSPSRANGLMSMIKQIKMYALALGAWRPA